MRVVQYRILTRILDKVTIPDYIYAFEKGKSIPVMAQHHVGKDVVVSVDIKDFFPSIKQHVAQDLFQRLGFGEDPARTLSELVTYKSYVPQGALTSPKLSNIIAAATFGPYLKRWCDNLSFTLTIYADDITVSYDTSSPNALPPKEVLRLIAESVRLFGFRVNYEKNKVMRRFQRQYVCGAVVNSKVNLQRKERDKLRAIVHNTVINGVDSEAAKSGLTNSEFVSRIMGRLNWFAQLNPDAGTRLKESFRLSVPDVPDVQASPAVHEPIPVPETVEAPF